MPSCLGLYIEDNVIKYAKVSKERETLKVEASGMKFYEKLDEAINQIVSETYSFKIPIAVNLSESMYNYFNMFSLLNKADMKKAIETEFESFCFDKSINKNAFESRYALASNNEDRDKIKVIHVSANKATISKIVQTMAENKVSTITPIGMSIPNIAKINQKENILIVNMEGNTTITSIVDQKVYHVEKLDIGATEVLDKIAAKENSYSKAYEICRNSTIYTMEGKELQDGESEYLEDIMPVLYKIVTKVQEYIAESIIKYDTIYITGTLSIINNADLYFQEYFTSEKCEILKPYFIVDSAKINMKDYIEVNSAIAIAAQGLGYGIQSMNFKDPSFEDKLPEWLKFGKGKDKNKETGEAKGKGAGIFSKIRISGFKTRVDATERWIFRTAGGILILTLLYSGFSIYLDRQITDKIAQVEEVKSYTQEQIQEVDNDISRIKQKTSTYTELATNLSDISKAIENKAKTKNMVPNFLVNVMSVIPKDVQLLSIDTQTSTTGEGKQITKFIIEAQSTKYEQLGYFKAKLREDGILKNVESSQAEKQGEFVKVIIEGELP